MSDVIPFQAVDARTTHPTPAEMLAAREVRDAGLRHIAVEIAAAHAAHDGSTHKLLRSAEHIHAFIRHGLMPNQHRELDRE